MFGRARELDGAAVFVIATAALTLASAACLPLAGDRDGAAGMLRASVIYILVTGWQPIVALAIARRFATDERSFDPGVRPVGLRESIRAVVLAVFVLGGGIVVEVVLVQAVGSSVPVASVDPSGASLVGIVAAFVVVVAVLWLQAIVEELAWRAYVLPRLMRTLGAWPGLLAHGVLWGLCYAPWFALTGGSVTASLGFVVTCGLLGVVFGWLRLATRSIYASAASNATLTITAGLPMLLVGHDSIFSAAFEPPGWVPLVAAIAVIVWRRRWRAVVVIPWRRIPEHVN